VDPADFYSGIVVDAYAKLKASRFDPAPYAEFVKQHGQPALELGCGDGEPLLDLCDAGLDVEGVDSSLDMVTRCKEVAARRGLFVVVHHQRMEALALERRYPSIFLAGPTFNLLADDDTALRALRSIHAHLTDDGVALIPLWIPGPTQADELGVSRSTTDEAGNQLKYTPLTESYDPDERTRTTACRYERTVGAATEVAQREWIIHWHTPASFEQLCQMAGLVVITVVDDTTNAAPDALTSSFTVTVRRS